MLAEKDDLAVAGGHLLALFGPDREKQRRSKLNRALDELVDRFGPRAVVRAEEGDAERAALSLQIKRGEDDPDAGS